jgi:hypothetical protein
MIDGPVGHNPRALAEVRRPSSHYAIELIANLFPGLHVAGLQLSALPKIESASVPAERHLV